MKCPGGLIGACQIDHNSKKGYNLGYVQSNPQIAANGELSLQYSGGSECHHQFNRSIRIVFSCSKRMVRDGIARSKCGERWLLLKGPITGDQGNNNPLIFWYLKIRRPAMCRAEVIVVQLSWISRFSCQASNFVFLIASHFPTMSKKAQGWKDVVVQLCWVSKFFPAG